MGMHRHEIVQIPSPSEGSQPYEALKHYGKDSDYPRETAVGTRSKYAICTDEWNYKPKQKIPEIPSILTSEQTLLNALMGLQNDGTAANSRYYAAVRWALKEFLEARSKNEDRPVFNGQDDRFNVDSGNNLLTIRANVGRKRSSRKRRRPGWLKGRPRMLMKRMRSDRRKTRVLGNQTGICIRRSAAKLFSRKSMGAVG